MILADYHLHTSFSSDSESPMEEMIRHAISLGLKTICFTEHHDIDYPVNPDGFDFLLDLPSYKEEIFKMKEHYQDQLWSGTWINANNPRSMCCIRQG